MTTSAKRTGLLGAGIVVLVVGLLAAAGTWYSASQRESDAVRNLARAPIGCDTTLDFEATGEYFVYIESAGRFDPSVSGDCGAEGDFALDADALPPVTLSLTAPGGDRVALDSRAGITYSAAGRVGRSIRSFTIDEPGSYRLRVEATDGEDVSFAAAVGRDPSDGVRAIRLGAIGGAVGAVVLGGLLLVLARRSSGPEPEPDSPPWPGGTIGWPTSPPGMPPPQAPTGQVPLGPPTQYPTAPPVAPTGPGWPPRPPRQPDAPAPGGTTDRPTWGPSSDGSSGDGQRSPWAPPSDSAR